MYLFSRMHTLNEHMEHSGRSAMTVGATHKKPVSDTVLINVFHPTTGGGRTFLLTRDEVKELHGVLGRWIAEGWAGFVDGAPGPGQGYKTPTGTVSDGGSVWDELDRRQREAQERDRKQEEAFADTYASWTHEELVQEIRLRKWNQEAAETRAKLADEHVERERSRVSALFQRLRKALDGKRTASVDDLNAALQEPEEETR
ncbi:hypothetical protein AB0E81_11325 [Streptomyces sp. NPDC033538]|uniref:hypothetical protein n=1 Tax=Streptomyces sp. NPDC033538 TaxID=3155367 RepID=UPI0033F79C90